MIANANSSTASQLLKLGEAADLLDLPPHRLRRLADRGLVRTVVLDSGHRLFPLSAITELLEQQQPDEPEDNDAPAGSVPVLLVARVSSEGQAKARGKSDKSDLDRQVNRLEKYTKERWGKSAHITKNVRVASGCNFQSKELHDLLKLIWSGKFRGGYLVATYFDRILRIGFELVELACEEFGVEVVYLSKEGEEDEDENAQMIQEILAIMTLYTARASGRKTIATQRRVLSEEQLRRAWTEYCAGYSVRTIAKDFIARGEQTPNGPVTVRVIENQLRLNKKLLMKLYPPSSIESNFVAWAKATLVPTDPEDTSNYIFRSEIVSKYHQHCERNKLRPISVTNVMASDLKKLGFTVKRLGHAGRTAVNAKFA